MEYNRVVKFKMQICKYNPKVNVEKGRYISDYYSNKILFY